MKILMVNKFLYQKGGAETYVIKLGEILKQNGHEVEYLGLHNDKNTLFNSAQSYVTDMDLTKGTKHNLSAPFRIIYNKEARKKIRKVLDTFNPDIVHLNNIHYHLTEIMLHLYYDFVISLYIDKVIYRQYIVYYTINPHYLLHHNRLCTSL